MQILICRCRQKDPGTNKNLGGGLAGRFIYNKRGSRFVPFLQTFRDIAKKCRNNTKTNISNPTSALKE